MIRLTSTLLLVALCACGSDTSGGRTDAAPSDAIERADGGSRDGDADLGATDASRADAPANDTLAVDTLAVDTLAVDTLAVDTLAPDVFASKPDLGPDLGPCGPGGCDKTADVLIDVSNSCKMTVVPPSISVPAGQTIQLTYKNKSAWYPVDIWQSYGGGFLDLKPGGVWAEKFIWCATPKPYTGSATISTACSKHVLSITCL